MTNLFRILIDRAVWWRIGLAFLALVAGSIMLFGPNGTFAGLMASFGGLPEQTLGRVPGATITVLDGMTDAQRGGYRLFQFYDGILQTVTSLFAAFVIGRAIKAFSGWRVRLERTMALPLAYLICELSENGALAVLASGSRSGFFEFLQQTMTSMKLWILFILLPLVLVSFGIAAVDGFRVAIGAKPDPSKDKA